MPNDATCFKNVYRVCGFTDLRKGIDTSLKVRKDGRAVGSESRMWVYRTGEREIHPIIQYEYQRQESKNTQESFLMDITEYALQTDIKYTIT